MTDYGYMKVTTPTTPVTSSAKHGWNGTLALDFVCPPSGECRYDHVRAALLLWWQPISVRPLRGPGGWRSLDPGARLWLPGEDQYFAWRGAARTNIVVMDPARIEQILERPYSQVKLEAWRGLDFQSPAIARLVAAMADDLARGCPAGPIVGDSLTTALVAYLDVGPRGVAPAETRPGPSMLGFERALQYIEENLTESLRIPELARAAGCSPKQLSRAFRERKGMLPHEYVLVRRVERAAALIDRGELGLAQIALDVGFADQSQMTKLFRRWLGTTPGRYRKRPRDWVGPRQLEPPSGVHRRG